MAGHPEDNENVSALAAAFGTYAQRLSEVGEFAKARRTLDLPLALDPSNGELAALYLEIEGASADREARAKGRLAAATGTLLKDLSIDPSNEAVPANLGMSEQVDRGI
jgi:tetratricopeptide (TPR) repeat protein